MNGPSVREIALTKGMVAIVDADDFERVNEFKWYAAFSGRNHTPYAQRAGRPGDDVSVVLMHRFILGAGKGVCVDHADGDGLNNSRSNIRLATHSQNSRNIVRPCGRNAVRGVSFHSTHRKWRATITVDGRRRWLGSFTTEADAVDAYRAASLEHYGEFSPFAARSES